MSCPSEAELARMLEGETTAGERARLEEHLSRCESCRRLFVDLHLSAREKEWQSRSSRAPLWLKKQAEALATPESSTQGVKGRESRQLAPTDDPTTWRDPSRRWLAAAAVLIVVGGLGGLWLVNHDPARAPSGQPLLREESLTPTGPQLQEPVPEAGPVGARISFRWSEIEGTDRYVLTILDPEGDVAYEAETPDSALSVNVEETFVEGGGRTYFWYVTSHLLDGTELESEIRRLTIR